MLGLLFFIDALYMETGIDLITLPSFCFLFVPLPRLRTLHFNGPRLYAGWSRKFQNHREYRGDNAAVNYRQENVIL